MQLLLGPISKTAKLLKLLFSTRLTALTQCLNLAPKGRTKVYISKDETVYFKNGNGTDVKVDVILSKGVEGMRYIDNQ